MVKPLEINETDFQQILCLQLGVEKVDSSEYAVSNRNKEKNVPQRILT